MIGAPLHTGLVSEVIPVAPRADVRAPLVMERLLPTQRDPEMLDEATALGVLARRLGPGWQRLVSAEFGTWDAQYIYERFVGVTFRELSLALRNSGRVLPMDVLRTISTQVLEGFASLHSITRPNRPLLLTDRSVGLSIDGRWCFALGALNHWLTDVVPPQLANDPEYDGQVSPDSIFFLSPEAIAARPETASSVVTRAGLFLWQLTCGGFHPYRGGRFETLASLTRYTQTHVRVPAEVHPQMTPAMASVLLRGVRFGGDRYPTLDAFREALDKVWPEPAASPQRTFDVVTSLTWTAMQKQLHALRREPLLPIRWDGVWPASRTPEEGLAVLEDQLLERLIELTELPLRAELPEPALEHEEPRVEPVAAPPVVTPPRVSAPRLNLAPRRPGLLARLLSFFGR